MKNTFGKTVIVRAIVLSCLLLSVSFAKPKPAIKLFAVPCSTVWEATKSVVQDHYDVLSINDQTQSGSFTTGSVWTGVRPLGFNLTGTGDSCTVSVTGHFSGLIHNDKGDFFQRIEDALTKTHSSGK